MNSFTISGTCLPAIAISSGLKFQSDIGGVASLDLKYPCRSVMEDLERNLAKEAK